MKITIEGTEDECRAAVYVLADGFEKRERLTTFAERPSVMPIGGSCGCAAFNAVAEATGSADRSACNRCHQ